MANPRTDSAAAGQPGDPAAREEGREGHGIGGQAADVIEETAKWR